MPPMINNGKAMYISPPITIPINITGKKITAQSNFIIPQDAFNPNIKNFPTNQIIQIANNNDNIFSPSETHSDMRLSFFVFFF